VKAFRAAAFSFVLLSLRANVAAASGHVPSELASGSTIAAVAAAGVVLPSETGMLFDRKAFFVVGWSWQVPITPSFRHRIVGGLNWVPASDQHRWGGRAGYRFAARDFIAGAGIAFDHAGTTWSPEAGVRFPPHRHEDELFDPSLHVILRADVALELNRLRGMTMLVGWTFF